ncbi:MAG TPA: hypothetical protein VF260_05750 [Bacilli bacterium]
MVNELSRFAKPVLLSVFCLFIILSYFSFSPKTVQAATDAELAAYWAPDFYQDVNDTYGYRADFITNFDYDGDWRGNNNWDNLDSYALHSYIYYSVVETETHYFIVYTDYHARDDGPLSVDKHENDMEGCMVVVRKDGSAYGSFQLLETLSHNEYYQYTNDPSISSGSDNVDGGVLMRGTHPKVFIQANGLSPTGGHGNLGYDGSSAPGGDGIVYQYGGVADVVTDATGDYTHVYRYDLKSIDEFWNRRNDIGDGHTFGAWGALDGDNYEADSAKLPWAWDDSTDGPTFKGDFGADPAHLVDTHLNGLGNFSHVYVKNSYYTHRLQISSVASLNDRDPFGNGSDIFVKFRANGSFVSDDRLWKKNDAAENVVYNVSWGSADATFGGQYSSLYNDRYVAEPPNSPMNIEIYDSDSTSGDELMGTFNSAPAVGDTVTWTNAVNGDAQITATIQAVR